jgi:tryptophan-rich sensory protein/uncharacterized protein YbjT (DUF2867 family)
VDPAAPRDLAREDDVVILLTGATGYVGGRLLRALRGRPLRCLARRPEALPAGVEVVAGDVGDPDALRRALAGVDVAYYLVHSMAEAGDFAERDRRAALLFGRSAKEAGVRRIVYLGGLGHDPGLSEHLASRQEVGRALAASGVPVVELRASVVIGAGSLPFEMARRLVEKLPVMLTPRWVRTLSQPIAIDDVVAYLVEAADADLPHGGVFEVGGAEPVSYEGLLREISRQRGKRRWLIPVPVLSPRLSSRWLSLVSPTEARIGASLIEGVRNETVVRDARALEVFRVRPLGISEAVRRALEETPPPRLAITGWRSFALLLGLLLACLAVGAIGSLANMQSLRTWFPTLAKPAWNPPDHVFGPVWTVLYVLMAVAAWRVWSREGLREARLPLALFGLQLLLNGAWSWIFFGARAPAAAFVEIVVLWWVLLATIVFFFARSRLAGWLLVPYLAWVSFATVLNASIALLNR